MSHYKMLIRYDGTRYLGWQKLGEPGSAEWNKTIQGKLESILTKMSGETVTIDGSGRTDAGVHARGQVASFSLETSLTEEEIRDYLNRYLPGDIAVILVEKAAPSFHARRSALEKTYSYTILNDTIPDPFRDRFEYRVAEPLSAVKMREAASLMVGTHDFRNFCSSKRMKKSTVRTIHEIRIEEEGKRLILYFRANGFLYNMVRILTGTLIEVGKGERSADSIPALFWAEKREAAGYTVPGRGLVLESVKYEENA